MVPVCCQPGPVPTNPFPVAWVAMTPLYTSTGPPPPGESRLSVVSVDPGLPHGAEHAPPGPHWESTLQTAPGVGPPAQVPPHGPAQTPPAPRDPQVPPPPRRAPGPREKKGGGPRWPPPDCFGAGSLWACDSGTFRAD